MEGISLLNDGLYAKLAGKRIAQLGVAYSFLAKFERNAGRNAKLGLKTCPGWDSNPHCTDFEAVSSTNWDTGASPSQSRARNMACPTSRDDKGTHYPTATIFAKHRDFCQADFHQADFCQADFCQAMRCVRKHRVREPRMLQKRRPRLQTGATDGASTLMQL